MSDRWHTAVHEAGHAVVGRVLDMPCGGVTIEPGYVEAIIEDPYQVDSHWESGGKFRDMRSAWRARGIAELAGREAEEHVIGRCLGGDDHDTHQIARCIDEIGADETKQLRRAARNLVRRHRTSIDAVALALMDRTTLTGEEVDRLVPVIRPVRKKSWWVDQE